ncbi:MAG: hypothetical protein HQ591_00095 [candidate division Zixibacteria bacterium]|nr:hypothetical protein [Candidatus Tariuqbacter arcticus]
MLDYYIGIDCGGTKTEAVLCDPGYNIITRSRFEGLNLRGLNPNIAAALVKKIIEDLTYQAGMLPYHITLTVLAAAGGGDPEIRSQVEYSLKGYMPTQPVKVITDAEAALAGAFKGEPGIVIIAGTGSIAWGKDSAGEIARAGGYGYILGDEGSGFWMGREALKRCLDAHHRSERIPLTAKICELWGLEYISDTVNMVYESEKPAAKTAEIAPLIFQAAESGDDSASEIIASAGEALGKIAKTLADKLAFEGLIKVCLSGGLSKQRRALEPHILKHLISGKFEIVSPAYEPAIGAVIHSRGMD